MVKQLQRFGAENEADVHFLVGQEEEKQELISAHKMILSSSSEVFDAIDVPADVFKAMLHFIYSADLSQLNGQNAIAVLYAAKKYNVIGLIRACLDFPIGQLQNVFFAFAETHFLGENSLLCDILSRDQLLIAGEFVIWEAALRWADEKCRRNGTQCSAQNRRAMLGPALYKIRFPCIFETDFSTQIVPSSLLTESEVSSIMQWHCSRPKPTCRTLPSAPCRPLQFVAKFPTTKRNYECRATLRQKIDNFAELTRQIAGDSKRSFDSVEIRGVIGG
ncbi:hypothetical protein niasHS_006075 [Heterodera schachtii]|uniref:BTB domain-containing protein n=1 Tax=Heterodera schachtii TaxID=97005 RepID=A0ABD2JW67_HETSC